MADDDQDDEGGYELEMPFLPVQSRGGPYDDEAFVAGYEMGLLDAQLGGSIFDQGRVINAVNREQADLIAMRHGFVAKFHGVEHLMCDEHAEDAFNWVSMTVRRTVAEPT